MPRRPGAIALLLFSMACSKASAPSAPTPPNSSPTRAIRLGGNLSFGDVQVGDTRTDGILVITNDGNAPLSVTGIASPDSGVYLLSWTSGTITPGASQNVSVRFAPTAERSYSGTLTIAGDQTDGTNTINITGTGTRPPRRGSVTDPAGDARSFAGVPAGAILTDLVGATIDIADGTFTIVVSFAPGTLSAPNVFCQVQLDTDENPATGSSSDASDAFRVGTDYQITFVNPRNSTRALVNRWVQTSYTAAGTADVTFPRADQARISFPMSVLDYDDGRLTFKVWSFALANNEQSTGAVDIMPSFGIPAGVTR